MNLSSKKIITNISFKYWGYRKNYDLVCLNDNIFTEYRGEIVMLRYSEGKKPQIIGEFSITTINLQIARTLNNNLYEFFKTYKAELSYSEIYHAINNHVINLDDYDKVTRINSIVLLPEYRKMEVIEEFFEFIYRDFYYEKNKIIAMVLPFQYNKYDFDYYKNIKKIQLDENNVNVSAFDYYSLGRIIDKYPDRESNEYKLFSIAARCGLMRIDESYLFEFMPHNVQKRMVNKFKTLKTIK